MPQRRRGRAGMSNREYRMAHSRWASGGSCDFAWQPPLPDAWLILEISDATEIRPSGRLGYEVVICVANDFDLGKLADRQHPSHIDAAVNVRRVRLAAGD